MLAYQENWGQGWDKPVRLYPTRDGEFGGAVPKDGVSMTSASINTWDLPSRDSPTANSRKT